MKTFNTFATFILVVFLAFTSIIHAEDGQDRIAKINVTGNERIDTGFIFNAIKLKENDPYDLDKVREEMKNIYKTGFAACLGFRSGIFVFRLF